MVGLKSSEGDQQQLQHQVERMEMMVVLVGWEVVVMVDLKVMMLVILVGGRALGDKDM